MLNAVYVRFHHMDAMQSIGPQKLWSMQDSGVVAVVLSLFLCTILCTIGYWYNLGVTQSSPLLGNLKRLVE